MLPCEQQFKKMTSHVSEEACAKLSTSPVGSCHMIRQGWLVGGTKLDQIIEKMQHEKEKSDLMFSYQAV